MQREGQGVERGCGGGIDSSGAIPLKICAAYGHVSPQRPTQVSTEGGGGGGDEGVKTPEYDVPDLGVLGVNQVELEYIDDGAYEN